MLTTRETNLIVASVIDTLNYNIIKSIYFVQDSETDLYQHSHDDQHDSHKCGYCNKVVKRKYNFTRHLQICPVKIIMDKLETVKLKEFAIQDTNHRLELMMPYNDERGLRMYIAGPPRCGKSHLIGQLLREYIRHYPKREIFLFSHVPFDRAIDSVIEETSQSLKCDSDLFTRVDLHKFLESDYSVEDFRGEDSKGQRTGSICIFDDID